MNNIERFGLIQDNGNAFSVLGKHGPIWMGMEEFAGDQEHALAFKAALIDLWNAQKPARPEPRYWKAKCTKCNWVGMSNECEGGAPIADTGDYGDLYCPVCFKKEEFVTVDDAPEPPTPKYAIGDAVHDGRVRDIFVSASGRIVYEIEEAESGKIYLTSQEMLDAVIVSMPKDSTPGESGSGSATPGGTTPTPAPASSSSDSVRATDASESGPRDATAECVDTPTP